MKNAAADNDATADTGAQRNENQLVDILTGPHPFFAERRCIGIVFEYDVDIQCISHFVPHRKAFKAWNIGRSNYHAGSHLNETGYSDANATQSRRSDSRANRLHGSDDIPHDGFPPGGILSGSRNLV